MEWLSAVRRSIEYMEGRLFDGVNTGDVANEVHISQYIFCKGFAVVTGYSVSEYIRNRRLYLAALALKDTDKSVLDIALDSGYDTPESFTKAFSRFHGSTPSAVRSGAPFKTFLPLRIQITVNGGNQMECKIAKLFGMKFIGFVKEFSMENSYEEIPKWWEEICEKYAYNVYAGNPPANAYEKALVDNCIGEFAVCVDDIGGDKFRYLIAGRYTGGEVPEGMALYEFPAGEWAIFDCVGPIPEALQSMNTRIFREWLPGNSEYEISGNATIEWYDCINGEKTDPDYHSAIWIPVKRK
ncbi:MAG: AraC family transcriptional regulator [Clostridia bacterium]|nr:AraC family transcriptional regulator [Clostridia bacterium]